MSKPRFTPEHLEALAEERWRYIFCPGSSGVPTESEQAIDYALRFTAEALRAEPLTAPERHE